MSMKITRYGLRHGCYVIKPRGIKPVRTDSLDEVAAAVAHYFGVPDDWERHEIYKKTGLCPLCEAMEAEIHDGLQVLRKELAEKNAEEAEV